MSMNLQGSPRQLNMFQSLRDSSILAVYLDPTSLAQLGMTAIKCPKSDIRQEVPRRQDPLAHYIVFHLNRKVPKLLDPWVPHPSSPHHVDHLNWMPMSLHKILLHSLDGHGSICLALSFLCSRKLALTLMAASSSTSFKSSSLESW